MSQLFNNAPAIVARLAKTHYVVLFQISGKYTPALDPGLNTVWRGKGIFGKKMGEEIVKDAATEGVRGAVMLWEDALRILVKQCGGEKVVEKELYDRLIQKHQKKANIRAN